MKKEVKKKLQRRIWGLLLSTTLVFGSVDVTAFATETVEMETQIQTETVEELETEIKTEEKTKRNSEKDTEQETKTEKKTQADESKSSDNSESSEMQTEEQELVSNIAEELESIETSDEETSDGEELLAEATSGTCGDNLTWDFDESTGILTIIGSGDMYDYSRKSPAYSTAPWMPFASKITRIAFVSDSSGKSLTSIGEHAFIYCSGITELELPSSLTNIGDYAFESCSRITGKLELPSGLTSIGDYAFRGCSGITELKLPSSLTSIGASAFQSCSGITGKLELPSDLTTIEDSVFSNCSGITELKLPSSLTNIEDYAFFGCSGITKLELPSSLTSIGRFAFRGCSGITGKLELPSGLTTIEIGAFQGCSGLTGKLELPLGLTSIPPSTFNGCSGLTELKLPSGLTSIGTSAFQGCSGLTGYVYIPKTVQTIMDNAFCGCSNMKRDVYIEGTDIKFLDSSGGTSAWQHFQLTESSDGTNVVTIHAPKGSTAEIFANQYDYYAFEEWDGVTPPEGFEGDPSSETFIINAQVPDDEFWVLIRDAAGSAITPDVLSAAAGHIEVVEPKGPFGIFGQKIDFSYEEVTFKDDRTDAAVTEGIVKVNNMQKYNRP